MKKNILVTGSAGFIGFHICEILLKKNYNVLGVDNLNNYYDVNLKKNRNFILKKYPNFKFFKLDLKKKKELNRVFKYKIDLVIHLAAQAGVRFSIKNPQTYIDNNISAFLNLLEKMKEKNVKNIVYASSSSVYGNLLQNPFHEKMNTSFPINMYAVTKKTNELMAHSYHHLYNFKTIGLRFFTVYGPWGRPDMSLNIFSQSIKNKKQINLFNDGNMIRDFTYIDDLKVAVEKIVRKMFKTKKKNIYLIFNVGNSKRVPLKRYLFLIFKFFDKTTKVKKMPLQQGDIKQTISSNKLLYNFIRYKPNTLIKDGINNYVQWFKNYYNV